MGSYGVLLVAAIVVGLIAGPLIERGLLRFMYGTDEIVLVLVTYALFLILEDFTKLLFGVDPILVSRALQPARQYRDRARSSIRSTAWCWWSCRSLVGVALALVLNRTRQGKILRAVIHDREMSTAMGINVSRVYLVTFTVGAMLAALGGALTAPTTSVQPGIGAEVIVLAFAIVVIGGLGSLGGAALGALIVGLVRSAAVHYRPEVELFSVYVGDGAGADHAAQGPVRRSRGAQDMTMRDQTAPRRMLLAALVVLLAVGPFLPQWALSFVNVSLYLGIVVLGMMLLMRTGLVSFGQGLYYCLGRLRGRHAGSFLPDRRICC